MKFYKVKCMIFQKGLGYIKSNPIIVRKSIFGLHEDRSNHEVFSIKESPIIELPDFNWEKYQRTGYLLLVNEKDLNKHNEVSYMDANLDPLDELKLETITSKMDENTVNYYSQAIKKIFKRK